METRGEYIDCPELVGDQLCNMPARVKERYLLRSTAGPIEHIVTMCAAGHPLSTPLFAIEGVRRQFFVEADSTDLNR